MRNATSRRRPKWRGCSATAPQAVAQTLRFLERCRFSLDELRYEYPDETRAGFATPQEALVAYTEEGAARALSARRSGEGARRSRPRIRADRGTPIRALFPHRPRHRALRPLARHSVPGPRLGGEFGDLLLPRHHRGRSRPRRSPVRALRLGGAARAARHRRRFRARAARGRDPVHLWRATAATAPALPPP